MRRVFLSNPNVTCNDGTSAGYVQNAKPVRKWIEPGDNSLTRFSCCSFFIRRSPGSRKWIIFLEGTKGREQEQSDALASALALQTLLLVAGGWYCYDTWSCHHRWLRLRHLMTSSQWPEVRNGQSASLLFPLRFVFFFVISFFVALVRPVRARGGVGMGLAGCCRRQTSSKQARIPGRRALGASLPPPP